jgi:hypothetical protein
MTTTRREYPLPRMVATLVDHHDRMDRLLDQLDGLQGPCAGTPGPDQSVAPDPARNALTALAERLRGNNYLLHGLAGVLVTNWSETSDRQR